MRLVSRTEPEMRDPNPTCHKEKVSWENEKVPHQDQGAAGVDKISWLG